MAEDALSTIGTSTEVFEALGQVFTEYSTPTLSRARSPQKSSGASKSRRGQHSTSSRRASLSPGSSSDWSSVDDSGGSSRGSSNKRRKPFRHSPKTDAETAKLIDSVRGMNARGSGLRLRATEAISHMEELETVSKLWVKAKQTLRERNLQISELQSNLEEKTLVCSALQAATARKDKATVTVAEFRRQLDFQMADLASTREAQKHWQRRYKQLKERTTPMGAKLQEKARDVEALRGELEDVQEQLRVMHSKSTSIIGRSQRDVEIRDQQLLEQTRQLTAQKKQLTRNKTGMEALVKDNRFLLQRVENGADQLREKSDRIDSLESRVSTSDHRQRQRNDFDMQQKLETLKDDNARLVKLLCSTDEYGRIFAAHSLKSHNYLGAYLQHEHERRKRRKRKSQKGGGDAIARLESEFKDLLKDYEAGMRRDATAVDTDDRSTEALLWVPSAALTESSRFHAAHMPQTPFSSIGKYLFKLHSIWRKRERRLLRKVRERYSQQLKTLKRQMEHRLPYNEVLLEDRCHWLKREVVRARAKATKIKNFPNWPADAEVAVVTRQGLERTLQLAEDLGKQLKLQQRRSAELQRQCDHWKTRANRSRAKEAVADWSRLRRVLRAEAHVVSQLHEQFMDNDPPNAEVVQRCAHSLSGCIDRVWREFSTDHNVTELRSGLDTNAAALGRDSVFDEDDERVSAMVTDTLERVERLRLTH